jgi:hypothetical protein
MAAEFMSWGWRGQPDLDELDRIVANMSCSCSCHCHGGMLRVRSADTGGDEYGIVITDEVLDQAQVDERWDAWWRSDR